MPERPAVVLVDGIDVPWTEVEVGASVEAVAATVRASWPVDEGRALPRPGSRVQVQGPQARNLLVGSVDRVTLRRGRDGLLVSIAGRERTADLIDGSPVDAPAEWAGATLLEIARDLALRVGVTVVDESDGAALEPFLVASAQPGDSAMQTLERLARERGLLLRTDDRSRLAIRRPGVYPRGGRLRLAELEWSLDLDGSERFRTWVVRGQAIGGDDSLSGAAALAPEGRATDEGARETREQLVLAQGAVDADACAALAAWHASVSAARGDVLEVTWTGWDRYDDGPVWEPGSLIEVEGLDGSTSDRLLAHVTWTAGTGGSSTRLGLVRPDAYALEPTVPELDALAGLESLT